MDFASRPNLTVVGCSGSPGKAAHDVPLRMREHGFPVTAVNPSLDAWEGEPAFRSLADAPRPDWVVVFRPSPETPAIAKEAVAAGAKGLWLQLGIANEEARSIAEAAGLSFVQDKCVWVEFRNA